MLGWRDALTVAGRRGLSVTGRSSRSEFWWVWLTVAILLFCAQLAVETLLPHLEDVLSLVLILLSMVVLLPLEIRRLHDRNMRGWWLFC